ncbi:MAG: ADP-ribosylglycohydrolase family protein, partial [Candidatus Neomarinimicrobiota bacterium]
NVAAEICDKVGHIMNYGDGWYGGVYVAAMYSLAFVSDDAEYIVKEALKMIPKESQYAKCISDVIKWYHEFPDDWKETWWRVHKKWSEDIGCPDGVFTPFNIDAKINSAWVVLGLLYGKKDFGKTIEIAARCGDDSDCNPATAGGILGTIIGYNNIPEYWKKELKEVEDIDFIYTETSLKELYDISYKHAIANIKRNGGKVKKNKVMISLQDPRPVKLEVGFKDHFPVEKRFLWRKGKGLVLQDTLTVGFYGNGFVINGKAYNDNEDYVFKVEVYIDGKLQEVTELPCNFHDRKNTLFWKYQLPVGKHKVFLKLLNPSDSGKVSLSDIVVYSKKSE